MPLNSSQEEKRSLLVEMLVSKLVEKAQPFNGGERGKCLMMARKKLKNEVQGPSNALYIFVVWQK